jgi:hypothetical protein
LLTYLLLVLLTGCASQEIAISANNGDSLQSLFVKSNTTYVISSAVNLNGQILTLPNNCTLRFKQKGALLNGTIKGNHTLLSGNPYFDNIRIRGTFRNQKYQSSWCSLRSISTFIEDVMNLADNTVVVIDRDLKLSNQKRYVNHLALEGKDKTITNSDRYIVTYGGTTISNLNFKWDLSPVNEPKDHYDAVVLYFDLIQKDTTVVVKISNVDADGSGYCSYFMKQYNSKYDSKLRSNISIHDCNFRNFTLGALWTCGGTGVVSSSVFTNIGYDNSSKKHGVSALRLGNSNTRACGKVSRYVINHCKFHNIVAPYNPENDGRELHGILAYGDSLEIRDNVFSSLSTSFSKSTDTGKDSEMLYVKGSYNLIENNRFENGAGASSDGMVTLKGEATKDNIVRNNHFISTAIPNRFVYLCGQNHIVEGNIFESLYSIPSEITYHALYLGHREGVRESVTIKGNTFLFNKQTRYMAIYANGWGDISVLNNKFYNPTLLFKNFKRTGSITIQGNTVVVEGVVGESKDSFIMVSGDNGIPVLIENNDITCNSVSTGIMVNGSNIKFNSNRVVLNRTTVESVMYTSNSAFESLNNTYLFDKSTIIKKGSVINE